MNPPGWLRHIRLVVAAALAVIGIIIAYLNNAMGFIQWVLGRPKIKLQIEDIRVSAKVANEPREPLGNQPHSEAFDSHIFVYVDAVNIHREPTAVKKWNLEVSLPKGEKLCDNLPMQEDDNFLFTRAGKNRERLAEQTKDIRFEQRQPYHGWLHFRVNGITAMEVRKKSKVRLIAVDVEDRKHKSNRLRGGLTGFSK